MTVNEMVVSGVRSAAVITVLNGGTRSAALTIAAISACLMSVGCQQPQTLLSVDDSYTVGQRYQANRPEHPEIAWPSLSFSEGQAVTFDLPYRTTDRRDLHLDLFSAAPARSNGYAVLLVHGGGWRSGNKSHLYPLAHHLSGLGYTVAVPEYRLSPEAPYPAGLVDLNDAIVWLKGRADEYGFDPESVVIGGGSSGGHMAALLAYSSETDLFKSEPGIDTGVIALVDMDGVLDLTTPGALRFENQMKDKSAFGLWVGGSYEKKTATWQEASPAHYLGPDSPPTLIISSGLMRFTEGREEVCDTLDRYGIPNAYFQHEDLFHTYWLFEPYVTEVADRIDAFVRSLPAQEN